MSTLAHQRCRNHEFREAAVRCPECRQFFCRECVVEFDDRMLCSTCVARAARRPSFNRARFIGVLRLGQVLLGFLCAWLFFYAIGQGLLTFESSFHDATLWRGGFLSEP